MTQKIKAVRICYWFKVSNSINVSFLLFMHVYKWVNFEKYKILNQGANYMFLALTLIDVLT